MLQRLMDDFRTGVGSAVRLTAFGLVIAVSLFVTIGFLSAASFMFVLPREGAVAACFAGGGVFFLIGALAAAAYAIKERQERRRLEQAAREAAQSAKSTTSTLFSDPAVLAIGLQLVRVIGVRRMVPLLAIGGLALGLLASQRGRGESDPTDQ
jgi:malonyl CoA-acyl carrier protein transacylase